jgi:hypothetical protein
MTHRTRNLIVAERRTPALRQQRGNIVVVKFDFDSDDRNAYFAYNTLRDRHSTRGNDQSYVKRKSFPSIYAIGVAT